ncbi:MAG TPA: hypothetical protein VMS43_00970 [Allosphingosinicella sp.]|nr:hypothetical protein [Allosphingosinicella sp.]
MAAILLSALALATQAPAAPSAPPPPPACAAPEHHQFDFWVGRWDVYPTGTERLVAHSLIERLYGDWVIRESWMPLRGGGGSSLNAWRPGERRWRQLWADSANSWAEFSGGLDGAAMVLIAGEGPTRSRMTYSRQPAGAVRQLVEQSTDGGATWTAQYDFTYRPAASR